MSQPAYAIDLDLLQPSQLYISSSRLESILAWMKGVSPEDLSPLPVKELNGRLILTDGHHRAFAACLLGHRQIIVEPDQDELDWEAYQICVDWCLDEKITSVSDLQHRVVDEVAFDLLWNKRCDELHQMLEDKRAKWS